MCLLAFVPARVAAQVGVPQAPRAGVTIAIRDASDGRPIPGRQRQSSTAAGAEIANGTSAADGIVRIAGVAGTFTAQVSAQGYAAASATVTAVAGQLTAIDLTLTKSALTPASRTRCRDRPA